MIHQMNLWDDSFQAIKEGWKTIEMRLNDEKRSLIKINDKIEFTNTKTNETILCKVINIFCYSNFEELYKNHDKLSIGYKEDEVANYSDMYKYYAKDKIEYMEDGSEQIHIFIYSNNEEELKNKLFAKISKYSSVPILPEWKEYLLTKLQQNNKVRALYKFTSIQDDTSQCHRVFVNKEDIKNIVKEGLKTKAINIKGNNNASPILSNIHGLNDYLNCFGETLAEKIQTAFKPKFTPGEDEYDTYTNFVDDFMYHEANIELFEAQKSVIQATVNNLKVNDATFEFCKISLSNLFASASSKSANCPSMSLISAFTFSVSTLILLNSATSVAFSFFSFNSANVFFLASLYIDNTFGSAIITKIAKIAITANNSTNVNPFFFILLITILSLLR